MLTIRELIDLIVMICAVGFIFSDVFRKPVSYDPLTIPSVGFDWESFKFACMVTAPAIVLHELAHKFVAQSFGVYAMFQAAYFWLFLGIVFKLMRFGFIFFVPGYVSIGCITAACAQILATNPIIHPMIAVAGPLMNLGLWLGADHLLKKGVYRNHIALLVMTKQINMFLFIFNMLPIPGFDGYHFFTGALKAIF